jgi:hypothetical protein
MQEKIKAKNDKGLLKKACSESLNKIILMLFGVISLFFFLKNNILEIED